jgi:polyisoprenoid-binding protein YceI
MRFHNLVAAALLTLIPLSESVAQSSTLVLAPESKLWIDGTSNKSDWTATVTEMEGSMVLGEEGRPERTTLSVAAGKIESGRGTIMDRLMYRALKTQSHPTITYTLSAVDGLDGDSLSASGEVEVAGVTKPAPLRVQWLNEDGGAIRVRGSHPMKMTDHGMKPPTAMFGALHTADDVTVHFDVVFTPAVTTETGS